MDITEIFYMCLLLFGTERETRDLMRKQLLKWATVHRDILTRGEVLNSIPRHLRATMESKTIEADAAGILTQAVSDSTGYDLPGLVMLFQSVSAVVWQKVPMVKGDLSPSSRTDRADRITA